MHIYLLVALIYTAMCLPLAQIVRHLERRAQRNDVRTGQGPGSIGWRQRGTAASEFTSGRDPMRLRGIAMVSTIRLCWSCRRTRRPRPKIITPLPSFPPPSPSHRDGKAGVLAVAIDNDMPY